MSTGSMTKDPLIPPDIADALSGRANSSRYYTPRTQTVGRKMGISVYEIARLTLPRNWEDGWLCMLTAYFDDSGTHADAEVVTIAGLVGVQSQWDLFERAWRAKLKAPLPRKPSLKYFHMSPCEAREGEFRDYSKAECDAVIHDFRQIILDSQLHGYAMAVSRNDWEDLVVERDIRAAVGDGELYCFADCVSRMKSFAIEHTKETEIALVFDNRPHRTDANQRVFHYYQNKLIGPELVSITFLSSVLTVPLQGADMWAWETYRYAVDWLHQNGNATPRPHLKRLIETGRFESLLADRNSIQAFVKIIGAELERQNQDGNS